jgi:RNA polymerase-binding transcription factor DksA
MKPIDPKWAWHYDVLLKLRDRLLKDKGDQLGQVAEPLEPHSMSMADSATDEFDHDLALALLSAEQDALNEVDEAIRRIVDGTYGVCLETGKPIPRARLRALPWTRFSKEVEARLEATGIANHAHIGNVGSVRPPPPGRLVRAEAPPEEND